MRHTSRQRARIQAARRGVSYSDDLKSQVERQRSSMAEHKFKIGERVYFNSRSRREVPPGPCQIVKRLPAANGEFQYIVRSEYKDHQHVAKGRRAKPLLVFPPCRRLSSLAIFAHAHWRHRMGGCLGRARSENYLHTLRHQGAAPRIRLRPLHLYRRVENVRRPPL